MGTYGNLWELMGTYGNLWELMGTYGNLWELMGTYGNLWELMGTYGNLWELMGTYGNLRSISEIAKHLTESDFQRLGEQLRSKKSSILNSVLEIIPDNMKYKAKCICDKLIQNDSIFLNDKYQLIVHGEIIPNSNICTKIIEALTSCPNPGESIQPTRTETKLKTHVPRNETRESESMKPKKSENRPGITKFKTMFIDDK